MGGEQGAEERHPARGQADDAAGAPILRARIGAAFNRVRATLSCGQDAAARHSALGLRVTALFFSGFWTTFSTAGGTRLVGL